MDIDKPMAIVAIGIFIAFIVVYCIGYSNGYDDAYALCNTQIDKLIGVTK